MSVNRVWLIGHVAALPRQSAEGVLLLVATVHSGLAGEVVDRHLVWTADEDALGLQTGTLVLVQGRLARDDRRRRHVVVAATVEKLEELSPADPQATPTATHASPVSHRRTGHFRRVGVGTPRERLVWVRATTVGSATL